MEVGAENDDIPRKVEVLIIVNGIFFPKHSSSLKVMLKQLSQAFRVPIATEILSRADLFRRDYLLRHGHVSIECDIPWHTYELA